jgi:phenylpropionate dioxygenase-like ring-hydroxylating dioxygenase large terminal subunit
MGDVTPTEENPGQNPWPRYEQAALGLRQYWYPALLSSELRRRPVGLTLLGEELVFVRDDHTVYALEGRCKHRGVPLFEGRLEFSCAITCAYHGWTYNLASGQLVAALIDGADSPVVGKIKLRTYPVVERKSVIWVFLGDEAPPPLEDNVPSEFLDERVTVVGRHRVWKGNWRLAVEGALDPSHSFYLHRFALLNTFKMVPASKGKYTTEILDERYLSYKTDKPMPQGDYPGLGKWPRARWWKWKSRGASRRVSGWLPCGVRVQGQGNLDTDLTIYSWYVPVDAEHYRWFQFVAAPFMGLRRYKFLLKYYLWLRPLYQEEFLRQDVRMNELIHTFYAEQEGWKRERLYRPDIVITAWRKFVDANARGIQQRPPL